MTQLEFYKSFWFMTELIIAEGLFCVHLVPRSKFPIRLVLCLLGVYTLSYFFPVPTDDMFYISFMFLVLFLYTVVGAKILFRESWLKITFCLLAGYTTQHLAYQTYNLALVAMNLPSGAGMYGNTGISLFPNAVVALVYLAIYFVLYFLAEVLFGGKIKEGEPIKLKSGVVLIMVAVILVIDIVLNAVVMQYFSSSDNKLVIIMSGIYNILCCIVALFLQFEAALRKTAEESLNIVNFLRAREKEQYATSKKTIELINMRCHDLKHQIRTFSADGGVSGKSLTEIEGLISIYDATVKTGNPTLDIILTEKKLLCTQTGIEFSCIADGKKLDFMEEEEIYSLFGNLLDNSIEAVRNLEKDKRVIGLKVRVVNSLLSVNVSNYYGHEIQFENGMPKTTKSDRESHGYGLKSVRSICDRYDGDLSINAENNVFRINIMFPLAPTETSAA